MSLKKLDRQTIRDRRLITIPQDSFIIERLTWQENLQPSKISPVAQCESVLRDVNLLSAIDSAGGLKGLTKPDLLSHGQRQLFGLARAVFKGRQKSQHAMDMHATTGEKTVSPSRGGLLLLDEIASSVDEDTERIMHEIILWEFSDYTIIAVVHRAGSMTRFDTIVVIEGGDIKSKESAAPNESRDDGFDLVENSKTIDG